MDGTSTATPALTPLTGTIGALVEGVDLSSTIKPQTGQFLNDALAAHVVLLFRNQTLTPDRLLKAASIFGPPMEQHYSQYRMPEFPTIGVLSSRDAELRPDGSPILLGTESWHTDHTNHARPPKATILYALSVPPRGGDTSFANMREAYARLPDVQKSSLGYLRTVNTLDTHVPARNADRKKYATPAIHPLVRTHPENGTKALYFHPTKAKRIDGLPTTDSREFLERLLDQVIEPEIVYRHNWQPGDVIICDNRAALHQAHADYDPAEGRLLHRVIVEGDVPI